MFSESLLLRLAKLHSQFRRSRSLNVQHGSCKSNFPCEDVITRQQDHGLFAGILALCACVFRPDLSHMLREQGGLFIRKGVHREPNMNIIDVLQIEGSPNIGATRRLFEDRFVYAKAVEGGGEPERQRLEYPELQQYCVKWGGYFFWKQEPAFSIEEHVQIRLISADADIRTVQLEYLREPLPECRSPWQVLVVYKDPVPGEEPVPTHHLLFKYHHSLADGFSIVSAFMRWADPDTDTDTRPIQLTTSTKPGPPTPLVLRIVHWLTFPFRSTYEFFRLLFRRTPRLPWPLIPCEPAAGRKKHQYICIGDRDRQRIKIADIKQIALRHSVSFTAVVYAALTGAFRANFLSRMGSHSQGGGNSLPSHASLTQPVPLPLPFRHPKGLCNSLCTVTYTLPIGEPDPVSRLYACERMINETKQSLESIVTYFILQVTGRLPYIGPSLYRPGQGVAYIGTTNLVGPLKQIKLNGQKVLRWNTEIAATPYAFYISMISYNGALEWTCNGDTRVFSEPELRLLAESILNEFQKLAKLDMRQPGELKPLPKQVDECV